MTDINKALDQVAAEANADAPSDRYCALLTPMNDWSQTAPVADVPWYSSNFAEPIQMLPGLDIIVNTKESPMDVKTADGYIHIRQKKDGVEKDWAVFFRIAPNEWSKREFSMLDAIAFSKALADEIVLSEHDDTIEVLRVWFLDVARFGLEFKSVMYGGVDGRNIRSAWGPGDEPKAVNG